MATLSLAEVEQCYDEIVERVGRGEEIIVTRDGEAFFRMVPLEVDTNHLDTAGADVPVPADARFRDTSDGEPEESQGR